jgi:hypothetical protein
MVPGTRLELVQPLGPRDFKYHNAGIFINIKINGVRLFY